MKVKLNYNDRESKIQTLEETGTKPLSPFFSTFQVGITSLNSLLGAAENNPDDPNDLNVPKNIMISFWDQDSNFSEYSVLHQNIDFLYTSET